MGLGLQRDRVDGLGAETAVSGCDRHLSTDGVSDGAAGSYVAAPEPAGGRTDSICPAHALIAMCSRGEVWADLTVWGKMLRLLITPFPFPSHAAAAPNFCAGSTRPPLTPHDARLRQLGHLLCPVPPSNGPALPQQLMWELGCYTLALSCVVWG